MKAIFAADGFEVKSLRDVEQKKPRAWHWHVVAEKLQAAAA